MFKVRVGVTRVCIEHWRLRLGSMATQLPLRSPSTTHGLCNPLASSGVIRRLWWQAYTGIATAQTCCSVAKPTPTFRTR